MEFVNVVVTEPIGAACLQRISEVSPKIKVTDVSEILRAENRGDPAAREKLDVILAGAEVLGSRRPPQDLLKRAPGLKWVQVLSAGVDRYLDMPENPVIITNVSGIHATPISEFVLGLMLMFVKRSIFSFQMKEAKRWERFAPSVLQSKTVGIVGLGSIGREVARLSKAFRMRVLATRRSAKQIGRARYVDVLYPADRLPQLLAESDFVVLALPFTHENSKIIGEKELRNMKPTAYLINVARGGVVDEPVLIRALEELWIAGAGLDVFATEPLPADSQLWELPNVFLSPHISGGFGSNDVQATEIFSENLKRYLSGKRLLNVVDKKWGY